jgi:hypothetical protein
MFIFVFQDCSDPEAKIGGMEQSNKWDFLDTSDESEDGLQKVRCNATTRISICV